MVRQIPTIAIYFLREMPTRLVLSSLVNCYVFCLAFVKAAKIRVRYQVRVSLGRHLLKMWVVNSHFRRSSPIATFRDRENNGTKFAIFFSSTITQFCKKCKGGLAEEMLILNVQQNLNFFLLSLVFTFLRSVLLSFQVIGQETVFSSQELSFLPYKNNKNLTWILEGKFNL